MRSMKVAFFTNKPYDKCETFIKAQIDNLPFEIIHYWGENVPFNLKKSENLLFKIFNKFKFIKKDANKCLIKNLKKNKVEVVIAQYGMTGSRLLSICKINRLPLIVHFHGHDAVRKTILDVYKDSYAEMFNYEKTLVISVSSEMTRRLILLGCPEEKIIYNPYGPNFSFLKLNLKFSLPQFVGLGRFVEKKAPHLTILAFNNVLQFHPEAKLVLGGNGVLLDSCKDLVQALKMDKNVFFPGEINSEQFQQYLIESLAFVQHSIEAQDGDMEGTPVSVIEASGAGLPVVSTIHAGIPEVIINNVTGLLSSEKHIEQMSKNMIWMLENKESAIEMGRKGKQHVIKSFNMELYISKLAEAIISISK